MSSNDYIPRIPSILSMYSRYNLKIEKLVLDSDFEKLNLDILFNYILKENSYYLNISNRKNNCDEKKLLINYVQKNIPKCYNHIKFTEQNLIDIYDIIQTLNAEEYENEELFWKKIIQILNEHNYD